jgi:DNA-binding HxlR family transcriptional regulator
MLYFSPKVEYSLTQAGAALNDAVHALAEWGKKYASPVDGHAERAEAAEGSEPVPSHSAQGD